MTRDGPGRYRIGDFSIHRESPKVWRVFWRRVADEFKAHAGLYGDGFPTLREARASVEKELTLASGAPK